MLRACRLALLSVFLCIGLTFGHARTASADAGTHVVQPGETLYRIALNHGVTVDALRTTNRLSGNTIYSGQTLVIPGAGPAPAASPSNGVHVVQQGENLYRIGLRYGLSWTVIQAANGLASPSVYTGQSLIIPGSGAVAASPPPAPAPAPAPAPPPSTEGGQIIHIVQRGETLSRIGLKYGVSWPAIQAANGLGSEFVYTGQRLIIPGNPGAGQPAAAQPAAPATTNKYFLVDLSEQRLYAYEGDTLVRTTLVSTGRAATPTVTGTFRIYARYVSTRMRGPGYDLSNVPYTQYFYQGYGLHGTYWHSNFGQPMSHGCVNLPTPEAEWAYNWADYGTTVIVRP